MNVSLKQIQDRRICIGITGKAGAGKDTFAKYLKENLEDANMLVGISPFAAPLKWCSAEAFGLSFTSFFCSKTKETSDAFWGISPRKIAQFMGTEVFRNIDPNFWVRMKLIEVIETCYTNKIFPDVRFQNEAKFIDPGPARELACRCPSSTRPSRSGSR